MDRAGGAGQRAVSVSSTGLCGEAAVRPARPGQVVEAVGAAARTLAFPWTLAGSGCCTQDALEPGMEAGVDAAVSAAGGGVLGPGAALGGWASGHGGVCVEAQGLLLA